MTATTSSVMWAKNEVIRLQAAKLALMHQQQWPSTTGISPAGSGTCACAPVQCWPPPPRTMPDAAAAARSAGAVAPAPLSHHMYGAAAAGVSTRVAPAPALAPAPVVTEADDVIQRARVILSNGFHLGL